MFTKEELKKLGLKDELLEPVMQLYSDALDNNFVSKERFNEVTTARTQLEEQVAERDEQIKSLKSVNPDELKEKITRLEAENKEKDEEYQANLKNLRISHAAERQIMKAGARDLKSVLAHLDLTESELDDAGQVKDLAERLEELAKEKDFLFKAKEEPTKPNVKGAQLGQPQGSDENKKKPENMTYEELVELYS